MFESLAQETQMMALLVCVLFVAMWWVALVFLVGMRELDRHTYPRTRRRF